MPNPSRRRATIAIVETPSGVKSWPRRALAWRSAVLGEASAHPGRSAAAAVATGYVLAGGLFSPLTARLLATGVKVALRLAVLPFVTHGIVGLTQGFIAASGDEISGRRKTGSHAQSNGKAT